MITVLSGGMSCSIQDKGRFGFRHIGMPVSGAMDEQSAGISNLLLDNSVEDAVMEIGLQGPRLQFNVATWITITGAPKKVSLNGMDIRMNKVYAIQEKDILHIGSGAEGMWTYLGVKGGFQTKEIMGSRSGYGLADLGMHTLTKQDRLPIYSIVINQNMDFNSRLNIAADQYWDSKICVKQGPEFNMLEEDQKQFLFNNDFDIGNNSSRMAYYLNSESSILAHEQQIITSPVNVGTIQLPPSGAPMVLMKECQTTGGYPRILQVVKDDIHKVAQTRIGAKIRLAL